MGEEFAGETFLTLASEGRLVVASEQADSLIADLERTIAELNERLSVLGHWRQAPGLDQMPAAITGIVVDAVFADQLSPGWIEHAARELPKYVTALRLARQTLAAD
ncbi:hypothetical protein [Actinoplanes derwentensis]|uniref:Uncharacterized protein n=1 Tax=Actinoplanes derwentensis TaxID=113562 RepID=A0A1H2BDH2_9ACTN|nr:hypothetical protein [Actinoplanes derwentensis]GID88646.1 hypothetical protein Ade03nite_75700 [Actinoplanes derwentensis]SDT56117.1 hypothetical protein SAMN04489716_4522 [Actinoplanes derwentensis]